MALSTGISGALFFSPFFLLVVGLPPAQAIGAGLMTMLFGTAFATINYARQGVIDYAMTRYLLAVAIPTGMLGAFVALQIDASALRVAFGVALIVLAFIILWSVARRSREGALPVSVPASARIIHARDGREYPCHDPNMLVGMSLAGFGSALTGLMSAGLPELTTTQLIIRCKIAPRVAIATSIMVLTISVFFAAGIHALAGEPAWYVVVWSIPGVIIGAQIGPRLQGKVPANIAQRFLAVVFIGVGILSIAVKAFD